MPARHALPTGTVTFVFTDIEGSTRLLAQLGESYQPLLEAHAAIMRRAIGAHAGVEVNTEGDAFFAVFTSASDAVNAMAEAQHRLAAADWPLGASVLVRMGAHSGDGRLGGDDYIGMDVHRAARIASAAHGGQVIVSETTRTLLPAGSTVIDLGAYALKDLEAPERLYQVVIEGLPGDFPPPRARRQGNLPEPTTSFIGREHARSDVEDLLRRARLVTITGPGGVGKTRLALEAARELAPAMPDGAWFVPLDTYREADLLPTEIATALGLSPGGEAPEQVLRSHLADRELLLVLDNLEQIAGAGGVVDALVGASPRLRVLVTSQSPLGLYGEHEYPAPPLRLPEASSSTSPDRLVECESVALFTARARAAKPQFRVDEQNAGDVAELVRRLDGLPLAIELAAARIKLLTPRAILDRLEGSLDLLSSSAPNVPERQRTMRGAIDWSYGLLEPEEQHVFDRVGVFAGGFHIETAEGIVNPDDECGVDLLDALASLVDKSLLRQEELADLPRFKQLESIRRHALDRLAKRGEADMLRRRLAAHVARLVADAEPFLDRAEDQGWFERLEIEQDNLRAALRWAIGAGDEGLAQRIIGPVWRYWVRKGLLSEGTWWTDQVLALPSETTAWRAKALLAKGSLLYWCTDYGEAVGPYVAALESYRQLDDAMGVTEASYNLGYVYTNQTPPDQRAAREAFETALAGYRDVDDTAMTQSSLFAVGWIDLTEGELDSAERLFREALAMGAGDVRPRTGLAGVAFSRGDYEEARRWLDECVSETADMSDLAFDIVLLETYSAVEVADGQVELGMQLRGAADALRERIGGGPPPDPTKEDPVIHARAVMGDIAVDSAMSRGSALEARVALELALTRTALPKE